MSEVETTEVEISFRETVLAGQGIKVTKSYSQAGKITQILFHFPPGTNALVQLALLKDFDSFYPVSGYIALNDATPVYYTDVDYYANEPLTLEVLNTDSANPHTISCAVTIRFKKPSWW